MTRPTTPDFNVPRPLQEGDQALIDAIEQIQPGERGDDTADLIMREPAHRPIGTIGEVVVARTLNEAGQQEVAFIDISPWGILAGIDTREPGSQQSGEKQVAFHNKIALDATTPRAQAIKTEAARRIRTASTATAQGSSGSSA